MTVTMADVMRACNNFFERGYIDGTFCVSGGEMPVPQVADGSIVAVTGSAMNDGVYTVASGKIKTQYGAETFEGRVWLLKPPADFVSMCEEINAYNASHGDGGVISESFGNYSATYGSKNGMPVDWQGVFASQLLPHRRMVTEVRL